jgi:hypothetical protein
MKRIIYTNNDGGVSIVIPTGEVDIDTLITTVVPQGANYSVIDDADLPADRTFRGAWVKSGDAIDHDIEKAQIITKERLRADRVPLLEKLDIDYMKAIEINADTSKIVAEKQRLRDITKQVDNVTNLADLKKITV